jgi:hypothetical protein
VRGLIRAALIYAAFGLCMGTVNAQFTQFPNFEPATSSTGRGALEDWLDLQTEVLNTPSVWFNPSSSETGYSSVVWLPQQAGFHPGPNNEIASYEFVAPVTGDYQLSSEFSGRDFIGPTDTQVSVVDGYGTPIFTGVVNGYAASSGIAPFGPSPDIAFDDSLSLSEGDQLYFNVAWDPNGTRSTGPFLFDSTAIAATLTLQGTGTVYDLAGQFSGVQGPVWYYGTYGVGPTITIPELSRWAMMLLGFAGLSFAGYRRARAGRATLVASP